MHHHNHNIQQILVQENKQTILIEQQGAMLASIDDRVSSCTTQNNRLHDTVEALFQKAVNIPSLSHSQAADISEKLASLEKEIVKMRLGFGCSTDDINIQELLDKDNTHQDHVSPLRDAIKRLCCLVDRIPGVVESDDADEIVRDLEYCCRIWSPRIDAEVARWKRALSALKAKGQGIEADSRPILSRSGTLH